MLRSLSARCVSYANKLALACTIGTAFAVSSSHAYIVTEIGDAGQTQATAQNTSGGQGALTHITGSLLTSTDADLYIVNITNPMTFSASTRDVFGGAFDTQIFLLTLAGAPVYFNNDADGSSLLSSLPAGSAFAPVAAGNYLLAIAGSGFDPVNSNNQLLFDTAVQGYSSTDVIGPNGSLQPALLAGFSNDGTFDDNFGAYDLQLTGVGVDQPVSGVPEPTTGALVLLAGAICAVVVPRRRRQAAVAA